MTAVLRVLPASPDPPPPHAATTTASIPALTPNARRRSLLRTTFRPATRHLRLRAFTVFPLLWKIPRLIPTSQFNMGNLGSTRRENQPPPCESALMYAMRTGDSRLSRVDIEPVTQRAHGLERQRRPRQSQPAPQVPHVHLDHVGFGVVAVSPDGGEDLAPGANLTGSLHQIHEQIALALWEHDPLSGPTYLPGDLIQSNVGGRDAQLARSHRIAETGSNPRLQLGGDEWSGYVVAGPEVQAFDLGVDVARAR